MRGGKGAQNPFELATSGHLLPVIQQNLKMEEPHAYADSCFTLIGVHQCGVLMVDVEWLAACHLWFQWKQTREATVIMPD